MTETKIAICEATKPHSLSPWRCVRAAGHEPAGDHTWPIESDHYNHPLEHYDQAWLARELRMQLGHIKDLKRQHREATERTERRFATLLAGLINLAPGNSKRKNVPLRAVQELWQAAIDGR